MALGLYLLKDNWANWLETQGVGSSLLNCLWPGIMEWKPEEENPAHRLEPKKLNSTIKEREEDREGVETVLGIPSAQIFQEAASMMESGGNGFNRLGPAWEER